ncbi:TetR/AcrR family transcriptional regulator [uncultured Massilia sp.]|uniref:TetR/AcrR family transcriptional regulator n=1 Tax=uncultured Massilia sp. TaxID=169973 RepID=UPI0025E9D5D1|nr:TetR/AcrR family transcriptional regulator [uncultured Massilia sp.]
MRADARKNYDHLLEIGRDVVAEQGADASMRDVARRAGVGIGTLYRHFPTREALLEALLRGSFDRVTAGAAELAARHDSGAALLAWLRDMVALTHSHRGVIAAMTSAIAAPESALHASCVALRASGAQLLARAQADGKARADIDGTDLLALVSALAWLNDQPPFAERVDRLLDVVARAIMV